MRGLATVSVIPHAVAMKSSGVFGSQGGLLSVAELVLLHDTAIERQPERILELGHYYGLSTAMLSRVGVPVVSVDAHESDPWVSVPAPQDACGRNLVIWGHRPNTVTLVHSRTQAWDAWGFPFVFYDADHGEEQLRCTAEIIRAGVATCVVMDDADFPFVQASVELLEAAGFTNIAPPLNRAPGDKENPATMTLAILTKEPT